MKRKRNFLLPLLMAIVMMAMGPQRLWAGGTEPTSGAGTSSNPYVIVTEDNLIWFRDYVNAGNGTSCAKLNNDITLTSKWTTGYTAQKQCIGWNNDNNTNYWFRGTFDGNNKTISGLNMTINWWEQGLFGITRGCTIQDLTVKGNLTSDANVSSQRHSIGGVVGYIKDFGEIKNVHSEVNITMKCNNYTKVGGVVGWVYGTTDSQSLIEITDCSYSGTITLGSNLDNVGGIAGYVDNWVAMSGCNFSGTINTYNNSNTIGGIVGCYYTGSTTLLSLVNNCTNSGTMNVDTGINIGGIAGYAEGYINFGSDTFASSASIKAKTTSTQIGYVAGIVGHARRTLTVKNSQNLGSIESANSWDCIAGIVGYIPDNYAVLIQNCLYAGSISSTTTDTRLHMGGILGYTNKSAFRGINHCLSCGTFSTSSSNSTKAGAIAGALYESTLTKLENNYYKEGIATAVVWNTTSGYSLPSSNYKVTADKLASGEVCYLLNESTSGGDLWRQNISSGTVDTYPVLTDTHNKVYLLQDKYCNGSNYGSAYYSNNSSPKTDHHSYNSTTGVCQYSTIGVHGNPASGSGTSTDPYQISNQGHLVWFSDVTNGLHGETRNLAAQGQLTTDLDMSGISFTSIGLYSDTKSTSTYFKGVFDGQGHVISNLSVTAPETYEAGFVSRLQGTVKNLILYKETVKAKPYVPARVGGIAGLTYTNAVISCCGVIGATLTNENDGTVQLGGIVGGYAAGAIAYTFTDHNKFFGVGDLSIHTNCFENVSSTWKTSGELCFRLNGGAVTNQTWHQNLSGTSTDAYPIPTATNHNTVYITLNNNCELAYTNTAYTNQTLSVSVGTAAKLNNVARLYGNGFVGGKVNVTLTGNIDYKSYTTAADMIGNADHPYSGIFNANGYTVNVAFNTSEEYAALFRYLDGATIKGRLHVTGSVTTSAKYAAGVAARLDGSASTFDEIWSQVTINSSLGTSSSHADGTHGGFVGVAATDASFTACFFDGKFNGAYTKCWGGLVGWTGDNKTLTINNCYLNLDTDNSSYDATGSATWARGSSGKLTGSNNCHTFTMGATWSDARTLDKGAVTSGELCWYLNGGTIDGNQKWNQKIGSDNIPCWASYRANVADTSKNPNGSTSSNTVYQGYYHGQSTLVYSNHVVHTSAAPHHTATDYVNGIYDCSTCYATVHEQPSGSGTSDSPYIITNAGTLLWFCDLTNSITTTCYGKMTDDVDMNGINWNNGIGESGAKIYFNGNNHSIKNLNTGTANSGGKARALFCHNYGSISGLTLESPDIYHNDGYQGCLVRRNWATIENCLVVDGKIQAGNANYLAGFCGVNEATGVINNCGIVNTTVQRTGVNGYHADAFVDTNCSGGVIKNCYAKGANFTNTSNSWFVAFNRSGATLSNCYFSWGSSVSGTKHTGCIPGSGSEIAYDGLHLVETSQFTDGYATFKLNNNAVSNQVWHQNLSGTKDAYPIPSNTHSTVYITLNNDCEFAYTNTAYANQTLSVSPGTAAKLNNVARLYANGFTGGTVNVTLTNDIDYTAYTTLSDMIGLYDIRPYKGVFNGQGHSLKVAIEHNEDYVAPFRCIDGATIKNLYLYGSVKNNGKKCAAGVASRILKNACTLENIICDVQINSTMSGSSANGGLVAHAYTADVTINNCAYRGQFNGADASDWGGFIGWIENDRTGTITNSYVALDSKSSYTSTGCATFARKDSGTLAGENNYYYTKIGDVNGTDCSKFAAGELCYKLNGGEMVNPTWRQNLGTNGDTYPVQTKTTSNIVYGLNRNYNNTGKLPVTLTTFDGKKYGAIYTDFPWTIDASNVKAYIAESNDNDVLTMKEVTSVPAGTSVVLVGSTDGTASLTYNATATGSQGILSGSDQAVAASGKYLFGRKDGIVGFYTTTAENIAAFKPYLETEGSAKGFSMMFEDVATSLTPALSEGEGAQSVYNLNGQKLAAPRKGINIINGKKVMVK